MTQKNETFLLQDSRTQVGSNMMFWAGGYSSNIDEARKFTWEAALAQNRMRPTDVPWPEDYVRAHSRRVVDVQYLEKGRAIALDNASFQGGICVQCKSARFDGNDIYFYGKDGKSTTTNLTMAELFSLAEAQSRFAAMDNAVAFWPQDYLETKYRMAALASTMDSEEALGTELFGLLASEEEQDRREREG